MCKSLNIAVNKCINKCFVHLLWIEAMAPQTLDTASGSPLMVAHEHTKILIEPLEKFVSCVWYREVVFQI